VALGQKRGRAVAGHKFFQLRAAEKEYVIPFGYHDLVDQSSSQFHAGLPREGIDSRRLAVLQIVQQRIDPNQADHFAQGIEEPRAVHTEAAYWEQVVSSVARAYSTRLAFYHAVCELVSTNEVFTMGFGEWKPTLEYKTPHGSGGIPLNLAFPHPEHIARGFLKTNIPVDVDIFLKGVDSKTLHSGIREAIEQSLDCFRRGLLRLTDLDGCHDRRFTVR
jgi:hypothetical protein